MSPGRARGRQPREDSGGVPGAVGRDGGVAGGAGSGMECGGEAGEPVALVDDAAPAGGVGADVAAGLLDEFGPGLG